VAWLVFSTGMAITEAVIVGCLPFIIGDIIKLALAFYIARWALKIHPIRWTDRD
jgi:biotin transporter BioY